MNGKTRNRLASIALVFACTATSAAASAAAFAAPAGDRGAASPHAAPPKAAGVVTIAAAASLRDAVTRAGEAFEKIHPSIEVRTVFGPSNQLARQIVEGAPVDLLAFADTRSLDVVLQSGKIDPASRVDLLTNALVIIAPASSTIRLASHDEIVSAAVAKVAICDDAVPIGHYARSWLAAKGLLPRLEGRIVRPDDARATLAMVETEGVDLGFVYQTDARVAKTARVVFEIPASETPGIVYPLALVKDGPNPAAAKDLLGFLRSDAGSAFFVDAGFIRLPD